MPISDICVNFEYVRNEDEIISQFDIEMHRYSTVDQNEMSKLFHLCSLTQES
ncbi:hypothetical protein MTBBW1_300007 [Desulfamplus magnetovallimortis]|uniref:Uncharacterized protein n=1 Tax=Desulfamplus magnetovallimortis TaxID=1246637 RepID=A0A1W1HFS9_9BACT|nr:hypothetical protein MTBBW1_300007 [Desulfamplus magnetovallimortis]